jgi:hypothetical protein
MQLAPRAAGSQRRLTHHDWLPMYKFTPAVWHSHPGPTIKLEFKTRFLCTAVKPDCSTFFQPTPQILGSKCTMTSCAASSHSTLSHLILNDGEDKEVIFEAFHLQSVPVYSTTFLKSPHLASQDISSLDFHSAAHTSPSISNFLNASVSVSDGTMLHNIMSAHADSSH